MLAALAPASPSHQNSKPKTENVTAPEAQLEVTMPVMNQMELALSSESTDDIPRSADPEPLSLSLSLSNLTKVSA